MLAKIRTTADQPLDLTLTTNGSILRKKAVALKAAGLHRLTISLDGLNDGIFKKMNDVDFPVTDVLDGIAAAQEVGFTNLKVNMVVKKGTNDQEIISMAKHFKGSGVTLRFIEFMDVGSSNGWDMSQVLPSREVANRINAVFPIEAIEANYPGEVAQRWRYLDGSGEIGFISSVTQTFCHDCTRARISTDGQLYLCLFANEGFDFKTLLRSGKSDLEIANAIMSTWSGRNDHYSEIRGSNTTGSNSSRKVEMSYIGG
jgi:cyclic pyranopterin phosphate synthase